jgi:hypothetical protein
MKNLLSILFLVPIFFSSCQKDTPQIVRSFYHWKTDFKLEAEQIEMMEKLNIRELYVKYFDVVWNGKEAVPVAELNKLSTTDLIIKPVVYITTEVFSQLDSTSIEKLALDISDKIKSIHGDENISEIQIDCDWTPSIQDKYFNLLEIIKSEFHDVLISATIRLYQYKYPGLAGVPPVDKGLLMYYNMGDLTDYEEENSILNNEIGKQYLGFNDYPLSIDIALPNFNWSLHFRSGEFQQICPNFNIKQLENKDLFEKISGLYSFKQDTVIDNVYFRYGDQLSYEYCSGEQLKIAADLLLDEINQEQTRIIFYDLQLNTPDDYEKLDTVFRIFDK